MASEQAGNLREKPGPIWSLIEGETIAIDSFKIRGSNSLKNNFNEKKLKQHLDYIDNQIKEYEIQLDNADKLDEQREIEDVVNIFVTLNKPGLTLLNYLYNKNEFFLRLLL